MDCDGENYMEGSEVNLCVDSGGDTHDVVMGVYFSICKIIGNEEMYGNKL